MGMGISWSVSEPNSSSEQAQKSSVQLFSVVNDVQMANLFVASSGQRS